MQFTRAESRCSNNQCPRTSSNTQIPQRICEPPQCSSFPTDNRRYHKTTNPFLAFFLKLCERKPHVHITKLASIAGQRWNSMNQDQKKKYVEIARAEKIRRDKNKQNNCHLHQKIDKRKDAR